ncbi:hypothetical protein SAMN05421736_101782 [Evansella caseinilytica]|uniref:Uncharacterized protein n=1 Tax=Evansella caseinilytica TaxID=1503961 RepID=A0A1H3IC03_9BACI|nr:hypothetical protein SAMN05421736_101782 [Evansella caseinilytica]
MLRCITVTFSVRGGRQTELIRAPDCPLPFFKADPPVQKIQSGFFQLVRSSPLKLC